jgi:hypothetical protein|tara:strand:+ start:287 stop:460 length:174 start_codon:yes stop_codon:yes gene_type:complete
MLWSGRFAVLLSFLSWLVVGKIIEVDDLNGMFQRLFIEVWLVWATIMAVNLFSISRE